jgi:hypothetical protein
MSISGTSSSVSDPSMSVPDPSMSWDYIVPPHTYMDITDSSSSWMSWGDALYLSTGSPGPSTSWYDY